MARKQVLKNYTIIPATNIATDPTITSAVTAIAFMDNICIQFVWSGTSPVGALDIQGSATYQQDELGNVIKAGTWTSITLSPTPAVSGNTGSWLVDMNQLSFPYIRAVYTRGSGSGTLTATIAGKEV